MTVPTWARSFVCAAATLFVWVVALVLFGACLGSLVGLVALGGLRGVGIGAMRGGGIAFAVGFPFYVMGIWIGVQENMRRDRHPLSQPAYTEPASLYPQDSAV